nr:EAL domain-containing protein [Pleionea sp. CnH1-48]
MGQYSEQNSDNHQHGHLNQNSAIEQVLNEYVVNRTQHTEFTNQLRRHSFVDATTGLGNRDYFDAELEVHLKVSEQVVSGAVIFLSFEPLSDLDHDDRNEFDSYIKAIGEFVNATTEQYELCWAARRGQVDFAILVLELTPDKVRRLCKMMIKDLSRSLFDASPFKMNYVSVGAAFFVSGEKSYHVLSRADMALRHAQLEGFNKYHMYSAENIGNDVVKGSVRWRAFLQNVLEKRSVILCYQPQFYDEDIQSYEVLARLKDRGKLVPASVFLPMANSCGLAAQFDRVIVDMALKELTFSDEMNQVFLNINIFPQSLMDRTFVEWLVQRIAGHKGLAHRIMFEVSEFSVCKYINELSYAMETLFEIGCRWCIEHVGDPTADLDYINQLPIYALKLDQTIIRSIQTGDERTLFIQSLVHSTQHLGIQVWADAVESESEWQVLQSVGVTGGQGYWFAKPENSISSHLVHH